MAGTYVINEIGNSVTLFDYEPGGGLIERRPYRACRRIMKTACADLKITPDGRLERTAATTASPRIAWPTMAGCR
jgi:hypothetical protein